MRCTLCGRDMYSPPPGVRVCPDCADSIDEAYGLAGGQGRSPEQVLDTAMIWITLLACAALAGALLGVYYLLV
jgi:hypothetical protein